MRELVVTIDMDILNGNVSTVYDIIRGLKQQNNDYECHVVYKNNKHNIITGAHIDVYKIVIA